MATPVSTKNRTAIRFQGAERDCLPCTHRVRCLRTPEKTATRQVAFFGPLVADRAASHTEKMRERIDSAARPGPLQHSA